MIQEVTKSMFAIQLDESTDISHNAILLCYVRYIDYDYNDVKKELLCRLRLPSHATGFEIYKSINNTLKIILLYGKNWIDLCTDGAVSMLDIQE